MDQNPVVISQSKEADADYNILKIAILGVFGIGFSILTSYFFQRFLTSAEYSVLLLSAVCGVLFAAVVTLQAVMIKSQYRLRALVLLEGVLPLILFYAHLFPLPSSPLITGAVVSALFLSSAARRGSVVLFNSLKVRFFDAARAVVPKAITGIILLMSIIFYVNYFEWGNFREDLGQKLTYEFLRSVENGVKFFVPSFSVSKSLDEVLKSFTEQELQKQNFSVGEGTSEQSFESLGDAAKQRAIAEVSQRFLTSLERVFGPLDVQETIQNLTYRLMKEGYERLPDFSRSIISIVITLLVFFSLKGIAALFYWFIELIAFLIFKFLLVIRFAHLSVETRNREFISLS